MSASTSSSVGNRPSAFLENASLPSMVISNTPPPDETNSTLLPGLDVNLSLTRRAVGS